MANVIGRRGYLDWARGLAVLIMIQAHLLDSWTRLDARGWQFEWAMIVAGFGAPLFLFLAGVSVVFSATSKWRRSGDAKAAAATVMRRGAWIFFLAFVFRVQAWILGWAHPRTLLRVDILNIMGPSIVAAGALWGACRTARTRAIAFAASAIGISLLTPIVRSTHVLDSLPDPIEAYVRYLKEFSNFSIFPSSGFVFAGAVVGVLLEGARTTERESRLNVWLFAGGTALAASAYAASFLPSPYAHSEFWGGSPAYFALRCGILTLVVPVAYVWERLAIRGRWSPMEQLGRSSLFIYWIHIEMVYGLISLRIHKTLTHGQAWAAYAAFVVFMLLCSIGKDRVVRWWSERKGKGKTDKARRTEKGSRRLDNRK